MVATNKQTNKRTRRHVPPRAAGTALANTGRSQRSARHLQLPQAMPDFSVSDGTLAGSVLELAQTLTKNNAELRARKDEHTRLTRISAEFKQHLAWQSQRIATLKHNLERLHNETTWLEEKGAEVAQDVRIASVDLRQVHDEVERLRERTEHTKLELGSVEEELRLEGDAVATLNNISGQANKAVAVHTREMEAYKLEVAPPPTTKVFADSRSPRPSDRPWRASTPSPDHPCLFIVHVPVTPGAPMSRPTGQSSAASSSRTESRSSLTR